MTTARNILMVFLLCLFSWQSASALSEHYYDDDFIIASIVIADPTCMLLDVAI